MELSYSPVKLGSLISRLWDVFRRTNQVPRIEKSKTIERRKFSKNKFGSEKSQLQDIKIQPMRVYVSLIFIRHSIIKKREKTLITRSHLNRSKFIFMYKKIYCLLKRLSYTRNKKFYKRVFISRIITIRGCRNKKKHLSSI